MAEGLGEKDTAGLLEENLEQERHALEPVEGVGKRMAKSVMSGARM